MKHLYLPIIMVVVLGASFSSCGDSEKTDSRAQFQSWEQNEQNAKEACLGGSRIGGLPTECVEVITDERAQFPSWEQNEQNAKERCLAQGGIAILEIP